MTFETRFTWEKLVLELKLLRNEDFASIVPLCIGINSLIWPKDGCENCFRQMQFLNFEIQKNCEDMSEGDRWEALRKFIFEEKGFQLAVPRPGEMREEQLLLKSVLEERSGHPLTIVFLLLHMAHFLDLPIALIQARHHFLLKWVRSGKTLYLDLYNEGRALTDEELIQVLNRSSSNLEVWSAGQMIRQYIDLLIQSFEATQSLPQLHIAYNLLLQLDEGNITALGQRALLRHRLGFSRDALSDLKRYFSFVDQGHAPAEIRQVWLELESAPEPKKREATDLLH